MSYGVTEEDVHVPDIYMCMSPRRTEDVWHRGEDISLHTDMADNGEHLAVNVNIM